MVVMLTTRIPDCKRPLSDIEPFAAPACNDDRAFEGCFYLNIALGLRDPRLS